MALHLARLLRPNPATRVSLAGTSPTGAQPGSLGPQTPNL
jgi:hypothetical protein